jgi:hypothetical protein
MWLPETAVDRETLRVLAGEGVRFVILAPHQVSPRLASPAAATEAAGLDPTHPYTVDLGGGRVIAVFAYDGAIAHDVAFGGLLHDGDRFAERLRSGFRPVSPAAAIVHIATDGETYGHHHRFGEMALAHAIRRLEAAPDVELTNYASFLARHPPLDEAVVHDATSWSCPHGLERWRSGCDCSGGRGTNWTHAWRGPLRSALEALRATLASLYAREAGTVLRDPWAARDAYMAAQPLGWPQFGAAFLTAHARWPLDAREVNQVRALLEMERHALAMFTSCAWFFDDIAGIETVQVLRIADRALALAEEWTGESLAADFAAALALATGNRPAWPTGAAVYERLIRPARFDAARAAASEALLAALGVSTAQSAGAFQAARVAGEPGIRAVAGTERPADEGRGSTSPVGATFVAQRWRIEHRRTGAARVFDTGALVLGGRRAVVGVSGAEARRQGVAGAAVAAALETDGAVAAAAALRATYRQVWEGLRCLSRDDRRLVLSQVA